MSAVVGLAFCRHVGGLGLIWSVAFWFLVYESPDDHPRIQKDEHDYIYEAMGLDLPNKSVSVSGDFVGEVIE